MATNLPPDKIMCLKSMHEGGGGHKRTQREQDSTGCEAQLGPALNTVRRGVTELFACEVTVSSVAHMLLTPAFANCLLSSAS